MKGGHFRYHLDKVETKIIPGQKKYVAQVSSIEIPQVSSIEILQVSSIEIPQVSSIEIP